MEIAIYGAGFALALTCAVLMGYAVQRGATCAVSAMDEIISSRRARKLLGIAEAALWVAGGLVILRALGITMAAPKGFLVTGWTIAGGVLLGVGALVNRACVFGTVARVGQGEWAYLLTPVGFIAGCYFAAPLIGLAMPTRSDTASAVLTAPALLALPFAALILVRVLQAMHAARKGAFAGHIWSPHHATVVIGIAFVLMLLTVGSWAYTEALADLAKGRTGNLAPRLILLGGLFAGSLIAGFTAGRMRPVMPARSDVIRCLLGGAMLGAGGVIVPGSNDGLLLLGVPLLLPYAWVAFGVMMASIGAGLLLMRRFRPA